MQIILILSLLPIENEIMAYIHFNVKETPFSVTVLLSFAIFIDSIIYFMGNIQGSVETQNNHMHATPYTSAVNIGSLTSILFIDSVTLLSNIKFWFSCQKIRDMSKAI